MRDVSLEEIFVKQCIVPLRQSRMLFELNNPKKRILAIGRFAHDADSLLRKECVVQKTKPSMLPSHFLDDSLWAIFPYDSGGREISKHEAAQMINESFGPLLLLSRKGRAVIKTEENELYLLSFKQ